MSRTAFLLSVQTVTGQLSTPAGRRVRGAHRLTFTPSLVSSSTLERQTRLWAQSPRISRFLPLKAFRSCPQTWRREKASSRAWVGCACQPSPALTTPQCRRSARNWAAPLLEWRMTMTSGFMAWRVRAVSFMLSPFWRLEPDFASPKVSAERRLPAMSKEVLVRVLGSAKKRTTLFPLRIGTFLTGRELISCRFAAVSSRWKSSSCVN